MYVSRTDPDSRKKTISEIKRRASSCGKWPHIVIFPEGEYICCGFVILGSNFVFLCFNLIIIHYHIQKKGKDKIEPCTIYTK